MNLTPNNVVIIADSIVLIARMSIATSSTMFEFVGNVPEPLDIPVDEW